MTFKSVAYILKRYPRLSETFIMNEIIALEEMGLKIRIISLLRSDSEIVHPDIKSIRAEVFYFPESVWQSLPDMLRAQAHFLIWHPVRWFRAFSSMFWRHSNKAVKRWLQAGVAARFLEDTDTCHIHAHFSTAPTAIAMMAGYLLDLRFSFTCHAKDVYAEGRLSSPGFFRNLSRASFVVCPSERTRKDILEAWHSLQPQKLHVIYNGLNLDRFRPRYSEPGNRLILSVGRLVEKKGLSYLIEACQLLRSRNIPFECQIVGYGVMRKSLIELISLHGLEDVVQLIGPLDQKDILAYYQKASVFCLPALIAGNDDRDVLPNVVKEAMAVGVPVVTTNIPGIEELVEHERTGLVVPQRDPQALAEALELLLDDRELRGRLAREGRVVVEERFDRRKNPIKLFNLFTEKFKRC